MLRKAAPVIIPIRVIDIPPASSEMFDAFVSYPITEIQYFCRKDFI